MDTRIARAYPEIGDATIVDCHLNLFVDPEAVVAELPAEMAAKGFSPVHEQWPSPITAVRDEITDPSDPAGAVERHLNPWGVDRAILTGDPRVVAGGVQPDSRYAAALMEATNAWIANTWFPADDRFLGSILVNPRAPEAAVESIRRWGGHPRMVQVLMTAAGQVGFGDRRYWPIYEAATNFGLPVGLLAGAEGHGVANPNTGAGYPNSAIERQSVIPANAMGQLLNMLLEGPFVEFPDLSVAFLGTGYSWLAPFLWRIDKAWKGLTDDYPWLEQPPSAYAAEHVRIVTARFNEGGDSEQSERMVEMIDREVPLLFGSNYPFAHGLTDEESLQLLPPDTAEAALGSRAMSFYGL